MRLVSVCNFTTRSEMASGSEALVGRFMDSYIRSAMAGMETGHSSGLVGFNGTPILSQTQQETQNANTQRVLCLVMQNDAAKSEGDGKNSIWHTPTVVYNCPTAMLKHR